MMKLVWLIAAVVPTLAFAQTPQRAAVEDREAPFVLPAPPLPVRPATGAADQVPPQGALPVAPSPAGAQAPRVSSPAPVTASPMPARQAPAAGTPAAPAVAESAPPAAAVTVAPARRYEAAVGDRLTVTLRRWLADSGFDLTWAAQSGVPGRVRDIVFTEEFVSDSTDPADVLAQVLGPFGFEAELINVGARPRVVVRNAPPSGRGL